MNTIVLVVLIILLFFFLGLFVGRWTVVPNNYPSPRQSLSEDNPVIQNNANINEVATLKKENQKLITQLSQLRTKLLLQNIAERSDEKPGGQKRWDKYSPISWPEDTPPEQTPTEFKKYFKAIAEEAEGEVDIVSIQCEEPPCMMFRRLPLTKRLNDWNRYNAQLRNTETWKNQFPAGSGHQGIDVDCGDGRKESVQIIWFTSDEWSEEFLDDLMARRWVRASDIIEQWTCLSPTDNDN
ncbi:MAG: hypothetical protein GY854_05990 [Deltaproteobacteria bacterium]|nr:hypothetical protein [Deltaproteobacteria bacterium]